MVPNQASIRLSEDNQAIYHVFFTILRMDKASFIKLLNCLSYHGINSMEELLMCYSVHDPIYEVNGNTPYLDSWIYENLSSICRFATKCVQEFNLFPENKDWLSIKSISDLEKHGFQINFSPFAQVKTISPPIVT